MNLDQFAAMLSRSVAGAEAALAIEVRAAGEAAKAMARDMIGRDTNYGWAPLAPSTLADKERKGYPVPSPLLRTGELRDSIEAEAELLTAIVGSKDKRALYQEMGTRHIPPRPFIMPSAIKAGEALGEAVAKVAGKLLGP